ncbi:MAG: RIP metalloprotease RseP [Ruminococcaceae bacterium]|nr:RIP metalloprotease RseP [Oscillospiraceae bacterium]
MSVIFAILLFSILIFVHELGHFMTAKLFGVQVNEFSMFMGPAIWKKQVGETLYAVRTIPIGGYCAMEGEDEDTDNPRSFQKAAWWKRAIILVAGSAMNFLAGLLIYAVLFLPSDQILVPEIQGFEDCCIFHNADGLQVGDEILEIDGEKILTNNDISMLLSLNPTGVHDLVVRRGDQILEFYDYAMTHTHTSQDGEDYSHYGFSFGRAKDASFPEKLSYIWNVAADNVRMVRLSLQMLISGQVGLNDMAGPVGIVSQMSDIASESPSAMDAFLNLLSVGGFIAINLAVMNLLPIPALDGGRVVCLLITTGVEALTRKKIDPKYEGYLHAAGMIALLGLMAVVMFKDIFVLFMR